MVKEGASGGEEKVTRMRNAPLWSCSFPIGSYLKVEHVVWILQQLLRWQPFLGRGTETSPFSSQCLCSQAFRCLSLRSESLGNVVKLANMMAEKKERQASCEITPSSFI